MRYTGEANETRNETTRQYTKKKTAEFGKQWQKTRIHTRTSIFGVLTQHRIFGEEYTSVLAFCGRLLFFVLLLLLSYV